GAKVPSRSFERDGAAHHPLWNSITGEEVIEADQRETFRERRVVTLAFRQVHRGTGVSPRADAVANHLQGRRKLQLDLCLQRRVLSRFLECLFGERSSRGCVVAVVANPGGAKQRLSPQRAG